MQPLLIDFAPRQSPRRRESWLAGSLGALLVATVGMAWLPTAQVEASHMATTTERRLPGADEAQAVDAAVRELNLPWLALLDAIESSFGQDGNTVLLNVEADIRRASVRLSGEARDSASIQALPAHLRGLAGIADVQLRGQEAQVNNTNWPVHFTLELTLQEGA